MIKTLLAGTVLSTGLFAGGVLGTEDVKKDEKVEKTKYTQTMESSTEEDVAAKDKVEIAMVDKDGNVTYKEIDRSEIPKNAVPAQPNPGNQKYSETIEMPEGTDSIPAKGEVEKAELDASKPAPENPEDQPVGQ